MNNFKCFDKMFSFVTGGAVVFSLCGCSSCNNSSDNNEIYDSSVVVDNPDVTSTFCSVVTSTSTSFVSTIHETTSTSVTSISSDFFDSSMMSCVDNQISTYTTACAYSDDDNVVLDYFDCLGNNLRSNVDYDNFLDNGKKYFIYCVDFLFYDGEIKGIKFSDLSDMAKQQLLSDISIVDDFICSKYPNYKETISENAGSIYEKAALIIKAGAKNINDFSRDKLGDEEYSKLKMYKDLFIDQTINDWNDFTDILGKSKSLFDNWYTNFKGQN